jgi:hypothetical protein
MILYGSQTMDINSQHHNLLGNRKWIFTGNKTCCTIPFWFAMVAILNQKWQPKYKNPPIWTKFGFQVDYDVAN